VRILMTVK